MMNYNDDDDDNLIDDKIIQVKSLTRTLEQLQKHGATIGVPLPGLPGNPMKDSLNGPR